MVQCKQCQLTKLSTFWLSWLNDSCLISKIKNPTIATFWKTLIYGRKTNKQNVEIATIMVMKILQMF